MLLNIFGTCDIFQDSLINQKLKRTVFIQNINFVLQYTRDPPKFKFLAEAAKNET